MSATAIAISPAEKTRGPVRHFVDLTAGRLLAKLRFTPNQVTIAGLFIFLVGCGLFPSHHWAGLSVAISGALLDVCDGSVAYLRGMDTAFGKILDSVCDRIQETAMFTVLLFVIPRHLWDYVMVAIALGGSITVSYVASRAETVGLRLKGPVAHIGGRHMRMPLLAGAVVAGPWIGFAWASYLVAALAWPAVAYRLLWIWQRLNRPAHQSDPTLFGWGGQL